jgi:hypothetical protein
MRKLIIFLSFFSVASAELNIGDRVQVPLTYFSLTFRKDYIETSDSGYARVILKTPYIYVLTMDTVYIQELPQQFIIPPDTALKIANLIDTLFNQIKPNVDNYLTNYFGYSPNFLDSDNDPRLFVVIGAFFVSDAFGLEKPNNVVGYFDPYYSLKTPYPRHEYIVLNCASILTAESPTRGDCSKTFNRNALKKALYFLYTNYVLYSYKPNEDNFARSQIAYYLASKASNDTSFFYGFRQGNTRNLLYIIDDEIDRNFKYSIAVNPASTYIPQVSLANTLDDAQAQISYLWFNFLEEKDADALKSKILDNSNKFYKLFSDSLIRSYVLEFHLKNLLNSKGYGYDYSNPFIKTKEIYPWSGTISIYKGIGTTDKDRWIPLPVYGAIGFAVLSPVAVNKPIAWNWIDNSKIRVYKIDTVLKKVDSLLINPLRHKVDSLKRGSERLFMVNLDQIKIDIRYAMNDTTPPTIYSFFALPSKFSLNTFEVFLRTNDLLCIDVGRCYRAYAQLFTPDPIYKPIIELQQLEPIIIGTDTHFVYYGKILLSKVQKGDYIFSLVNARDKFDNTPSSYPSDTITLNYLSPQSLISLYEGSLKIKNNENFEYPIVVKKSNEGFYIFSSTKFDGYVYIKGFDNQVIYYENQPLTTYYENGYLMAKFVGNGHYKVSTGKPIYVFSFKVENRNLLLTLPSEGTVKIRIFDISGRVLYDANKHFTSGLNVIELPLKKGLYIFEIKYNNDKFRFKQVIN